MIYKIIEAIAIFAFIIGGVSLGKEAVHPAWAYMAIYVILYAGIFGPRYMRNAEGTPSQAILFIYFVGLPILAAQWLLTH